MFRNSTIRQQKFSPLVFNLAFCDLISSVYFFICGGMAISASFGYDNNLQMTNLTCFYVYIPVVLSSNAGSFMILLLSVDRLMSVCWPFIYKSLSCVYIYGFIFVSWLYGLLNFVLGESIFCLLTYFF